MEQSHVSHRLSHLVLVAALVSIHFGLVMPTLKVAGSFPMEYYASLAVSQSADADRDGIPDVMDADPLGVFAQRRKEAEVFVRVICIDEASAEVACDDTAAVNQVLRCEDGQGQEVECKLEEEGAKASSDGSVVSPESAETPAADAEPTAEIPTDEAPAAPAAPEAPAA